MTSPMYTFAVPVFKQMLMALSGAGEYARHGPLD